MNIQRSVLDDKLINISSYLVFFIPFFLLTGPFMPDLALSVVSLIFIYLSIKYKEYKYFKNMFFYIFISFFIIINLSSLLSEYLSFSIKSSLVYFRFGLFSLSIWFLIENKNNFIKLFFYFFIFTYSLALLDGYVQFFFNNGIFGIEAYESDRLALPFNDKMILGGFLSRLFPLLLALLIFISFKRSESQVYYLLIFSLMVLTDILVYLTGERTALVIMIIATIATILFIKRFRLIRLFALFFAIIVIISVTISSSSLKERNITQTIEQLNLTNELNEINYLSQQHEDHIQSAWLMFLDKPIFGNGPNSFRILCSLDKYDVNGNACSTHPHNLYIQLLAETGIFGFLFILVCLSYVLKNLILQLFYIYMNNNKLSISDFEICIIICFLLTLFPFLPSQNFFNNWINVVFYLPIGFYLYKIYGITEKYNN